MTLQQPIKPTLVTQVFGETSYLAWYKQNNVNFSGHNGIDFHAYHGQPIYAAHDGIANYEIDSGGGHGVTIKTTVLEPYRGSQAYFKTIYWHLIDGSVEPKYASPIKNIPNMPVKAGDIIGYANSTGLSTGDHLHFGLKPLAPNGTNLEPNNGYYGAIDPSPYFVDGIAFKKDINAGEVSDEVKKLQMVLLKYGYLPPIPSPELGIYGPKTIKAVKAFQYDKQVASLPVLLWNGGKFVGPSTRLALNKLAGL